MHSSRIVSCISLQSDAAATISVSEVQRCVRSGRAILKKRSSSVHVRPGVASVIIGRRGVRMLLITCDSASVRVRVTLIGVVWSIGRHEGYGEGVGFSLFVGCWFICYLLSQRLVSFPEFRSKLRSMYVIHSLPGVMRVGVACPSDSVLELSGPSEMPCSHDLLHFPLRFALDDVWGGLVVVWSVLLHFLIRGEECCVEDVVDLPLLRNAQLIDHVREFFCYLEGAVSPWAKLSCRV